MSGYEYSGRELTAGQLGIWHAQQLDPGNPVYNIGEYLEIPGALDLGLFECALRQAASEVEAAHLRSRWRERGCVSVLTSRMTGLLSSSM